MKYLMSVKTFYIEAQNALSSVPYSFPKDFFQFMFYCELWKILH